MIAAVTTYTPAPNATATRSQSPRERLKQASDELVGSIFYGTLLRQMRSAELKGPYGHGGKGEEVFAAQLDQILAQRMGAARSTSLSDAIVQRYQDKAAAMDSYRASREGGQ